MNIHPKPKNMKQVGEILRAFISMLKDETVIESKRDWDLYIGKFILKLQDYKHQKEPDNEKPK